MQIPYSNENTILFTLARMNPPTPGHLDLVRQLIEKAVEINVQTVYLVLSKTNDNKDDPISCNLKRQILVGTETKTIQNMVQILKWDMVRTNAIETKSGSKSQELRAAKIQAIQVIPVCVPDEPRSTPFTVIGKLIASMRHKMERQGQTPSIHLFIMIGEDRAELADSISQFYYEKDVTIMSMNAHVVERPDMESYKQMSASDLKTLRISEMPVGAFSASFVRKLVFHRLKDQFDEVYRHYLDEATMDELYDTIQQGIERLPPSKKKSSSSSKKTTQKGTYPKIKHMGTHELHSRKRAKTGSPN